MHRERLRELAADRESGVERLRGALRDVGDSPPPDRSKLAGGERKQVEVAELRPSPDHTRPGRAVPDRGECGGRLAAPRLAGETEDTAGAKGERRVRDDDVRLAVGAEVADGELLDREDGGASLD